MPLPTLRETLTRNSRRLGCRCVRPQSPKSRRAADGARGAADDTTAPDVQAKIAQALDLIHKAGLPAGIPGYGDTPAKRYFDMGFECVAAAGDAWLMAQQMDRLVREPS